MASKLKAPKMIAEIKKARGNISVAAAACGVCRTTFYNRLNDLETVKKVLHDVREKRTDYVEDKLMELIDVGNITAIIFYLKTQAKSRGYVERQEREITGKDGKELVINLSWGDDDRYE